jgi:hypothetical protein
MPWMGPDENYDYTASRMTCSLLRFCMPRDRGGRTSVGVAVLVSCSLSFWASFLGIGLGRGPVWCCRVDVDVVDVAVAGVVVAVVAEVAVLALRGEGLGFRGAGMLVCSGRRNCRC